jgi:hypothetical protein
MNFEAIKSIYSFEMARTRRTLLQSVVSPVISTSLYFIVFGAAIGSRINLVEGVSYGAFITPGLIMLTLLGQCISNGSFGIYFPKFTGTIYEVLSAPVAMTEIVLGYVGAAATKGMLIGLIILATASFFVDIRIEHADGGHFQPVRFHDRHLGREFRAAEPHPDAGRAAAHLPWRQLLFYQHAATVLAGGQPSQSGPLSGQRLPLELLRHR